MKRFVTYAVMLAYLTVTLWPIQVRAQPYDGEYETAQQPQYGGKPKVAVYVSERRGYSSDVESALRTATISSLVRSGRYNVIERSDVIEAELRKQASGAVDDDQLTAFGRQAGAQYVCIADMTYLGNWREENVYYKAYIVSVRMIDVETAEVLALGIVQGAIGSGPAMMNAVVTAVDNMLSTAQSVKAGNMPKMAVYITGEKSEQREGHALYTYALGALFMRSKHLKTFKVIERSEAFTRQIDREHITQRSGHVDDSQIMRLGKQYGIERILVVSMEYAMNTYNISARIINVETARIERASEVKNTNSDLKGLWKITTSMVEDMMGITPKEASKKAEAVAKEERMNTIRWSLLGAVILAALIWGITHPKKKNTENSKR